MRSRQRFREALAEDHTDETDADGLAFMGLWKQDLPPVRFAEEQSIPIIRFHKGQRKEKVARPYFERASWQSRRA